MISRRDPPSKGQPMGSAHARALATRTSHLLVALLIAAMFAFAVWQALSNTSQTTTNSIEAGTLSITDDNPGSSALFTVPNVQDGSTGEKCITVENDGSIEYDTLLLSRSGPSSYQSLAHAITWDIQRLDGPAVDTTDGSCDGYHSSSSDEISVPAGGVALASATTDTELDALKAPGSKVSYRISYSVDMENHQQGQSIGGITFAWNATQSSNAGGTISHWASIPGVPAPVLIDVAATGDVYYINAAQDALLKVDHATKAISEVATLPSGSGPQGLAVSGGYAYVAATSKRQIHRIDLSNGTTALFAGNGDNANSGDGGPATDAGIRGPTGVAVDAAGNVYISSWDRIRKVDTNGVIVSHADMGGTTPYQLHSLPDGRLFVSSPNGSRVYAVDTTGDVAPFAGSGVDGYAGDGGPATNAALSGPTGIATDTAGNVYLADTNNCSIRKVDTNGTITTLAGVGNGGDYMACADAGNGGNASVAVLALPFGLRVGPDGKLYSAQLLGSSIRVIDL